MSFTTLEPTTIEDLDFEPACQSMECDAGHPAATHMVTWHMECDCYHPKLICQVCAGYYEVAMRSSDRYVWTCRFCGVDVLGFLRDLLEIRPL
jgi:hypothetical protein